MFEMKLTRTISIVGVAISTLILLLSIGKAVPIAAQDSATGARPVETPPPPTSAASVYLPIVYSPIYVYVPLVLSYRESPLREPSPADGSTGTSLNANLTWDVLDTLPSNLRFTILLEADDSTPDHVIAENLDRRAFDPFTFEIDTHYYWQVVAIDPEGQQTEGPVWTFHSDFFSDPPALGSMVKVPAGEFMMGCDPNDSGYTCLFNQIPLHPVYLEEFEIDKFEVTNVQYRACVDAGICNPPSDNGSRRREHYFDNPEYDYYPVMFVSHWDAEDYCGWVDKRLPTEAEWEKAARGAIDTRPWPWGSEPWNCTRVNRCARDTARVDDFETNQSPYGAVNMSGNVFEWVQDYFNDYYYYRSPYYNPINTVQHDIVPFFSIRGGSVYDNWWYARTSHRSGGHRGGNSEGDEPGEDSPLFRTFRVGFRCARSIPPQ